MTYFFRKNIYFLDYYLFTNLMKIKYLILFLFIYSPIKVFAWGTYGHMLITQIAMENIRPATKKEVTHLIKILGDIEPKLNTVVSSSVWADFVRHTRLFSTYHFDTHNYYNPDNYAHNIRSESQDLGRVLLNLTHRLKSNYKSENNPRSRSALLTDFEKAFAIRFLIHLVGDLHQPLHIIQPVYRVYRGGNARGGNLIRVRYSNDIAICKKNFKDSKNSLCSSRNLHSFWDSAAFLCLDGNSKRFNFSNVEESVNYANELSTSVIPKCVEKVKKNVDKECIEKSAKKQKDITSWLREMSNIAIEKGYAPLDDSIRSLRRSNGRILISKKYFDSTRKVSYKMIYLAGLRLAYLLDDIMLKK